MEAEDGGRAGKDIDSDDDGNEESDDIGEGRGGRGSEGGSPGPPTAGGGPIGKLESLPRVELPLGLLLPVLDPLA